MSDDTIKCSIAFTVAHPRFSADLYGLTEQQARHLTAMLTADYLLADELRGLGYDVDDTPWWCNQFDQGSD